MTILGAYNPHLEVKLGVDSKKNHKIYCQFKNYHYLCNRKNAIKREKAALAHCVFLARAFYSKCPSGGIGRRARFRCVCREA